MQAPVRVARSRMASAPASTASDSPSASTSRPSASVFSTSTVLPLRIVSTSPGLIGAAAGHVLGCTGRWRRPCTSGARPGPPTWPPSTAAAPDSCRSSCLHALGRLDRQPAGVERDPLAHQGDVAGPRRAGRRPAARAGRARRTRGPRRAGRRSALAHDRPPRRGPRRSGPRPRRPAAHLGQAPGRHRRRRLVDEVAGAAPTAAATRAPRSTPRPAPSPAPTTAHARPAGTPWAPTCRSVKRVGRPARTLGERPGPPARRRGRTAAAASRVVAPPARRARPP